MGQIFKNPTLPAKARRSTRQRNYLQSRKTDRGKVVKHEQDMQLELCKWMRTTLPGIHFRSDTGSGAFNSEYEKTLHNLMQSSSSEPDLMIFAARRGFHGMVLELKADGFNLRMKRDGRKIRVYKNSKGKIIERDYKVRLKGDWSSLHVEKQANCLKEYNESGYFGRFGVGLEACKKLICWYFEIPYIEQPSMIADESAF